MNHADPAPVPRVVLRLSILASLCASVALGSACAPPIAVVQDASTLETGAGEATVFIGQNALQTELGMRFGAGLSEAVELQAGGGLLTLGHQPYGFWFDVGVKLSLLEDQLALLLPVGAGINLENGESTLSEGEVGIAAAPTVIATVNLGDHVKLNPFARVSFGLGLDRGETGGMIAGGVSMRFQIGESFAITPELTYMIYLARENLGLFSYPGGAIGFEFTM